MGKIFFTADSDAIITKGIIALLVRVCNRQTLGDLNADLFFIDRIGLKENLSPYQVERTCFNDKTDETLCPGIPDKDETKMMFMEEQNNYLELESEIAQVLKNIYDPEIPVNIYDLGLIYEIIVEDGGKCRDSDDPYSTQLSDG
jgi:hypothetical protein